MPAAAVCVPHTCRPAAHRTHADEWQLTCANFNATALHSASSNSRCTPTARPTPCTRPWQPMWPTHTPRSGSRHVSATMMHHCHTAASIKRCLMQRLGGATISRRRGRRCVMRAAAACGRRRAREPFARPSQSPPAAACRCGPLPACAWRPPQLAGPVWRAWGAQERVYVWGGVVAARACGALMQLTNA